MSYRPIAIALCLFATGCGAAAPVTAGAAAPKEAEAAAGDSTRAPTLEAAPSASPASDDAPPPPIGSRGIDVGKDDKKVGQAVVDSKEPLAGTLSQEDIRRILEKNGALFGDCYTMGAGGKTKDFKAAVTVKATLGPTGAVNQVEVKKSSNNVKVDACVAEAFKKIKFPKPQGGTSVITFPINFGGVEQVN
jgi:TonB family protein